MKHVAAKSVWLAGAATTLFFPSVAHADVVIGPRVAYYFDNSNLRTSSLDDGQIEGPQIDEEANALLRDAFGDDALLIERDEGTGVRADQVAFPMIGLTVNFGDDRDRFTINGMYGEGSGDVSEQRTVQRELSVGDVVFLDTGTFVSSGPTDTKRYDLEITWQRRTSENFAFFAGGRYERLETTGETFSRSTATNNIDGILADAAAIVAGDPVDPPLPQPDPVELLALQEATLETFSVRAGVTAFVPFGEGGVVFFNGMVQASYQPDYSSSTDAFFPASGALAFSATETLTGETSLGPDMAVGAQFILTDNLALDMRYRAVFFFPVSGEQSFSDARVNHGFNIGLSLRL